jgi:DNA-directed RNA polymerase subunit H (RpoH/RPB5)
MNLHIVEYGSLAQKFEEHVRRVQESSVACRECVKLTESALEIQSHKRNRSDSVAEELLEALDNFGVVRTPGQKTFHREFFKACLPHIYGSDVFENDRERILRKFGFVDIRYEVLVVCPRRWGKTYSVALFIAAMAWTVPEIWISIFSTGQRASTSLLELVAKFLAHIGNGTENRILSKNSERLYVRGTNAADVRKVYSYPSSVQASVVWKENQCVTGWQAGWQAGWDVGRACSFVMGQARYTKGERQTFIDVYFATFFKRIESNLSKRLQYMMIEKHSKWFIGIRNIIRMIHARLKHEEQVSICFEALEMFRLDKETCEPLEWSAETSSFRLNDLEGVVLDVSDDYVILIDHPLIYRDAKYAYSGSKRAITLTHSGNPIHGSHETFHIDRVQFFLLNHTHYVSHRRLLGDEKARVIERFGADKTKYPKIMANDPVVKFFGWSVDTLVEITVADAPDYTDPVKYRVVSV